MDGSSSPLMNPSIMWDELVYPGCILAVRMATGFLILILLEILMSGKSNPLKLSHIFDILTNGCVLILSMKDNRLVYVYGIEYAKYTSIFSLLKLNLNCNWLLTLPVPYLHNLYTY